MVTLEALEDLLAPVPSFDRSRMGWMAIQRREDSLVLSRVVDPIVGRMRIDVTRPGKHVPGTHSLVDTSTARTTTILVDASRARTVLSRVIDALPRDLQDASFEALEALAREIHEAFDEHVYARTALPLLLRRKLVLLDPDDGSSLELADDLTIRKIRVEGYASSRGWVPEFVALALGAPPKNGPRATPTTLSAIPADALVDYRAMEDVAAEWARDGKERLERTGRWELLPVLGPEGDAWEDEWVEGRGALSVVVRDGALALEPSKDLVIGVNARSPRTKPFADMLAGRGDGVWQALYEQTVTRGDPLEALRGRALEGAPVFARYKELADALAKAGRDAEANLWLGLGYLRAHKVAGIARAKLDAAKRLDPELAGLAEAYDELAGSD